jgi:hypothetical protein
MVLAIAVVGFAFAACGGGGETSEEKAAHERFCNDIVNSVEQVSGSMSETERLQLMSDCMNGRNGADGAWEVQKQNYIVT